MKSLQEITAYYKGALHPKLLKLESQRKKIKKKVNTLFIPTVFVLLVIDFIIMIKSDFNFIFHLLFIIISAAISYSLLKQHFSKEYIKSFKTTVIKPLIHFIDPKLTYKPEKCVSKETYETSKIESREISNYNGSDFIYGNIDGINIKFSELIISVKNKQESDLATWGIFIAAEFPKHFKAHTLISTGSFRPTKGKKITMDSPLFNKKFTVYSTDEIEARYILSPSLMENILEYASALDYPLSLSFIGGNIYVSSNCGEILEPSLQKSLLDMKILKSYALSLHFAISIVESLKLNVKLYSKY